MVSLEGDIPRDQRDVSIWIGVPPGGTHLCKMRTRGFTQVKDTEETLVYDCDDPLLSYSFSFVTGKTVTIDAQGLLDPGDRGALQAAFDSDIPQIWSFQLGDTPPHGGYYTGSFLAIRLDISADEDEESRRVVCEMEWRANGQYQWIAAT